jgi:hypothetical protein
MDLNALGLTREEVIQAVAAKAFRALNNDSDDYDDSGDTILTSALDRATRQLREARDKAFREKLDAAVRAVCAEVASLDIDKQLQVMTFQETTRYGEPKAAARSLREHIDITIAAWLVADVDSDGLSKAEKGDSYWTSSGKRIPVLIQKYIQEDVKRAVNGALAELSTHISGGLGKMVQDVVKEKLATVGVAFKQ